MTLRGFLKFLFIERMGRRRPLPQRGVTPLDQQLRREFEERVRRAYERLDITVDLHSLRPRGREQ